MINLINIKKVYYPKKAPQVVALNDINLSFGDSGLCFIVGKSGSGKSTLLNILGGLDCQTSGVVEVDGNPIDNMSHSELDAYRKSRVGFVFQEYNLLDELSVGENLQLALNLIEAEQGESIVSSALDEVGLGGYYSRRTAELSGGEKQRVAIARAIIKSPTIILADEPTGSLDSETGKQIFEILKTLSADKLVVVVSHDREMAEKYGDRIIEIADGNIISDSSTYELHEDKARVDDSAKTVSKRKGLGAKNILKLGFKFLSAHSIRLIISIILATFALTIFGTGVMSSFFDTNKLATEMLLNSGEQVVCLGPELKSESLFSEYTSYKRMTTAQAERIESELNEFDFGRIYNWEERSQVNFSLSGEGGMLYTNRISGVVAVDEEQLNGWGFETIAGGLPQGLEEIAIPMYIADYFKINGIYDSEEGRVVKINDYSELIGKINMEFKIVGVIDTKFNMERYGELQDIPKDITKEEYDRLVILSEQLEPIREYSVHTALFVSKEYIDEYFIHKPRAYFIHNSESIFWGSQKLVSAVNKFSNLDGVEIVSSKEISILATNEVVVSKRTLKNLFAEKNPTYIFALDDITDDMLFEFMNSDDSNFELMLTDDGNAELNQNAMATYDIVGYVDIDNVISYYINDELFENTKDIKHIIVSVFTTLKDDINLNKKLVQVSNDKSLDKDFCFPIRYWIYDDVLAPGNTTAFMLSRIGLLSSIVFLIFAMLMIMNYLSTTINSSRKQIGILRALGAGNGEIFGIYTVEPILIGIIAFVLSTLATFGVGKLFNKLIASSYLDAQLLSLDERSVIILFITSMVAVFLGCLIPIVRLIRKKPIEIIRGAK